MSLHVQFFHSREELIVFSLFENQANLFNPDFLVCCWIRTFHSTDCRKLLLYILNSSFCNRLYFQSQMRPRGHRVGEISGLQAVHTICAHVPSSLVSFSLKSSVSKQTKNTDCTGSFSGRVDRQRRLMRQPNDLIISLPLTADSLPGLTWSRRWIKQMIVSKQCPGCSVKVPSLVLQSLDSQEEFLSSATGRMLQF